MSPSREAPQSPGERLEILVERTARLHRLTAHLATALRATEVASVVVDEGTAALGAENGALWRLDEETLTLRLMRSKHYSEAAVAAVQCLPLKPGLPATDAALTGEPIWISSRSEYEARYATDGTHLKPSPSAYSIAALPILLQGRVLGAVGFSFSAERPFDEDERTYLTFLALHCAQGFERTRLYEFETAARLSAEVAQERSLFLVRASAILGSSLDYEDTLRNVAELAVPNIGDWCAVELVDASGVSRQVAVAHVDPAKIKFAHELRRRYPPDPSATTGIPNILRTGVSELYVDITDEMLVASAVDAEHLRISRELGLRSAMAVPIRDRGKVVGVFTFITSDLARRYTQDDLLMAEQLAERAGAAIGNAMLYAEARDAIRARDEFMLIAGHELRTPLAALSLHHEALMQMREGTSLEKIRERGGKLKAQSERLTRLVEDLLDVSRISAGRIELECEEFDLGSLVHEIAERMRDEFERACAPLSVEAPSVTGRWDKARIDQIVTNLMTNALKYGKGTPVDVRLQQHGERVQLCVADQGIGIELEDQRRIFQRFERAVSPRKFGGLGLGLWITSQLVDAHGGKIEVESRPGAGASFTVTLPIEAPASAPAP